jgi:poly(glycerol-phosphate) alpha-glucosyltransferase
LHGFFEFIKHYRSADTVVLSGVFWDFMGIYCFILDLFATKRKCVFYPRGLLDENALRIKSFKKSIFMSVIGRRMIRSYAGIVCLSDNEKDQIEKKYENLKTCVIPNGLNLFSNTLKDSTPSFDISRKYILYLGRISEKKGLRSFLQIFKDSKLAINFKLILAGPYERKCFIALQEYRDYFEYIGPVTGEFKVSLLKNATLFVLPSSSEGLPMSIIEAMTQGCPCLITQQCNVSAPFDSAYIYNFERSNLELPMLLESIYIDIQNGNIGSIGSKGKKFAETSFGWDVISEKTLKFLKECVG